MTPIMRAASMPRYRRIVCVMGSQMGKTEGVFNIIGHRLDDDPTPTLYVGPTQKLVESMSSDRIIKMLRSVPSLWAKLEKGKRNKIGEKFIAGVRFGFAWAGSATELAGHPAGLVLVDERDRMDDDTGGEGDPVELSDARTATFPDGKVIVVSTPTKGSVDVKVHPETGLEHFAPSEVVESPTWKLWQEGTRFEWAWPCPDCGEYFVPRFRNLWWPEKCTPQRALTETRLVCPHCGSMIEDTSKVAMNARGVYVAPGQRIEPDGTVVGAAPDTDVASFWASGLCSPWRTFGQRARAFLAAVASGDQTRIQTVINTGFGELFAARGDAPEWSEVAKLRREYEASAVPEGVQLLTCGVDVQKNRLVYAIRGWGFAYESWLIEAGELWGETKYDAVWDSLGALFDRKFGAGQQIVRMGIDSGYKPGDDARDDHQVYRFVRMHRGRAMATKGQDRTKRPFWMSKIDVSLRGRLIKGGVDLWNFDADFFKTWVHGRLEWPDDQPGGFHLHRAASDDYCQQLVAEQRVVKPSGAATWIRVRSDNHYLDCEAINALMAHILGVHSLPKNPRRDDGPATPPPAASERADDGGFGRGEWNERF
jgi:phage terminase large subunit GpA-like protein